MVRIFEEDFGVQSAIVVLPDYSRRRALLSSLLYTGLTALKLHTITRTGHTAMIVANSPKERSRQQAGR